MIFTKYFGVIKKKIFHPVSKTKFISEFFKDWLATIAFSSTMPVALEGNISEKRFFNWMKAEHNITLMGFDYLSNDVQFAVFDSEEERTMFVLTYNDLLVQNKEMGNLMLERKSNFNYSLKPRKIK